MLDHLTAHWPPAIKNRSARTRRRMIGAAIVTPQRARARARAHAWKLIEATPAGFPWLEIAGKTLAGWVIIDMDATLVTAHSAKEGAAPTWKMGYGFHPLAGWCRNTRECLDMLLRAGNAGSAPSLTTWKCWPPRSGRSPPGSGGRSSSASTAPEPATT
jgi:hypothetical protein